jgi:hypothetical protein
MSCNPSVAGTRDWSPTSMIRQGCFQSFIKRIVKILWGIIAIAKKAVFQELFISVDCAERFPPCLRRSGYAQAGIKLVQHPCRITGRITEGFTCRIRFLFVISGARDSCRPGRISGDSFIMRRGGGIENLTTQRPL